MQGRHLGGGEGGEWKGSALPGRRRCDSYSSRLLINFPQGKAQHMGGDIGTPQQMAGQCRSCWRVSHLRAVAKALGFLGGSVPRAPQSLGALLPQNRTTPLSHARLLLKAPRPPASSVRLLCPVCRPPDLVLLVPLPGLLILTRVKE